MNSVIASVDYPTVSSSTEVKYEDTLIQSSFPEIHKLGNVGIFVLLKFENTLPVVISHMHLFHKFALKITQLVTMPNLIYFQQKLYSNVKIANFLYYSKLDYRIHA